MNHILTFLLCQNKYMHTHTYACMYIYTHTPTHIPKHTTKTSTFNPFKLLNVMSPCLSLSCLHCLYVMLVCRPSLVMFCLVSFNLKKTTKNKQEYFEIFKNSNGNFRDYEGFDDNWGHSLNNIRNLHGVFGELFLECWDFFH